MRIQSMYLSLIGILWLVTGCQSMDPKHFGMTEAQWAALDETAKTKYSKQYWSVKKTHLLSLKKSYSTPYKSLAVKFSNGTALMWPSQQQLKILPITFNINAGQCEQVILSNKANSTQIEVCYNGKELQLDPSHWQQKFANGALVIPRHHLWLQGMLYPSLSSKGYANLKNANIYVRAR